MSWDDVEDEWTPEIKAAHPTRSGAHDEYALAMKMVGNRHSKGELINLVTWLLVRLRDHGPGKCAKMLGRTVSPPVVIDDDWRAEVQR